MILLLLFFFLFIWPLGYRFAPNIMNFNGSVSTQFSSLNVCYSRQYLDNIYRSFMFWAPLFPFSLQLKPTPNASGKIIRAIKRKRYTLSNAQGHTIHSHGIKHKAVWIVCDVNVYVCERERERVGLLLLLLHIHRQSILCYGYKLTSCSPATLNWLTGGDNKNVLSILLVKGMRNGSSYIVILVCDLLMYISQFQTNFSFSVSLVLCLGSFWMYIHTQHARTNNI